MLFLIGLSWGGQAYTWKSARVCTIVIGLCTLIVFGLYQQYVVKGHGIIPPRIFKNVGYLALVMCACIGAMVYYSMTVLWPTIIRTVYTTDVMAIGWQSSVVGGGVLWTKLSMASASHISPRSNGRPSPAPCWTLPLWLPSPPSAPAATLPSSCSGSSPLSASALSTTSLSPVCHALRSPGHRSRRGSLGQHPCHGRGGRTIHACPALSTNVTEYMPKYVSPAAVEAGLPESSLPALFVGLTAGNSSSVPGITPEIIEVVAQQVQHSYIDGFKIVFYAAIPFGV